jgi:hypothetical protein
MNLLRNSELANCLARGEYRRKWFRGRRIFDNRPEKHDKRMGNAYCAQKE